jgi:hypothetical protein
MSLVAEMIPMTRNGRNWEAVSFRATIVRTNSRMTTMNSALLTARVIVTVNCSP